MDLVCFRGNVVTVLLVSLARARGVARFGAVIGPVHSEAPERQTRRASRTRQASLTAKAQPTCGSVQTLARVRLAPSLLCQTFEQNLRDIPAVRSAVHILGDVDYELRLECRDLAHLAVVLTSLRSCRGTGVVSTALVLGDVAGLGRRALSIAEWGSAPRPRRTRSA
jgi:Lrp/AsnC ligand binding domain